MTIANLPLLAVLGVIFSCIVYFLTYQPWDIHRFTLFVAMAVFVAITSQGLGFAIGTMFTITVCTSILSKFREKLLISILGWFCSWSSSFSAITRPCGLRYGL